MFLSTDLLTSFLISGSQASAKRFFFCFHDQLKVNSLKVSSFLGFSTIEIKPDDRYQIRQWISSDNHCPILYHVISFIQ